jgi:hypothetical protein
MPVVESVRGRNEFFIPAIIARLVATNQQNGATARVERKDWGATQARLAFRPLSTPHPWMRLPLRLGKSEAASILDARKPINQLPRANFT